MSATHEEISVAAYHLWEKRGRPFGFEDEIWFDAESQLRAEVRDAVPATTMSSHAIAPTTIDHRSIAPSLHQPVA